MRLRPSAYEPGSFPPPSQLLPAPHLHLPADQERGAEGDDGFNVLRELERPGGDGSGREAVEGGDLLRARAALEHPLTGDERLLDRGMLALRAHLADGLADGVAVDRVEHVAQLRVRDVHALGDVHPRVDGGVDRPVRLQFERREAVADLPEAEHRLEPQRRDAAREQPVHLGLDGLDGLLQTLALLLLLALVRLLLVLALLRLLALLLPELADQLLELALELRADLLQLLPDLLHRLLDLLADLRDGLLQLLEDALGEGLDLAGDLAGGLAQPLEQPVGDEVDDDDGGGGDRLRELRPGVAALDRLEEGHEEAERLDDAADRAPRGLQALDDGEHRARRRDDHRDHLLDDEAR